MNTELNEKYENLKNYLKELKQAAIAFSAGVDSTFLLSAAKEVLGEYVLAVIVSSLTFPKKELNEAAEFCETNKIKYEIIKINELDIEGFKDNPPNRCYLCKNKLFKEIKKTASKYNIENILEGSNFDDIKDYRPGRAAIKELGILSPLEIIKLTKSEIRTLSKERNLKTWNKPSFACLASRFPYGEEINREKLEMVEKSEQILCELGFHQYRVRIHNTIAKIEIEENEFEKILDKEIRTEIIQEFKKIGFKYTALDLKGYRTGSMNEVLI